MPCCHLTYEKYLNNDGTIDDQALQEGIAKYCQFMNEQRKTTKYTPESFSNYTPCRCTCHTKGTCVMH